jgi:hypothetical protein
MTKVTWPAVVLFESEREEPMYLVPWQVESDPRPFPEQAFVI